MYSKDLQKKLDELVKNSDYIVSSPDTIEKLKAQGLPIKSVFTTYNDYLDKLFVTRRKLADSLIKELPILDADIANTTAQSLYEEIKETFVLGIPGAGITLSLILLELSLKYRLFDKRLEDDPNSSWDHIEMLDFTNAVSELYKKKIITKKEKNTLDEFNLNVRNPYIHYNIKKLVKDMVLSELPAVNVETGDVTIHRDVKPSNYPHLWFSAKRVLDKKAINQYVGFCINWANKLLKK
jgi:hypothetical protein